MTENYLMMALEKLVDASSELLANALDMGDCYVGNDVDHEFDDYPVDRDGDKWYHDWWDLNLALEEAREILKETK